MQTMLKTLLLSLLTISLAGFASADQIDPNDFSSGANVSIAHPHILLQATGPAYGYLPTNSVVTIDSAVGTVFGTTLSNEFWSGNDAIPRLEFLAPTTNVQVLVARSGGGGANLELRGYNSSGTQIDAVPFSPGGTLNPFIYNGLAAHAIEIHAQPGSEFKQFYVGLISFPIADADGDGVHDLLDVCPGHDDQLDTDNDTVPDGCDLCAGNDFSGDKDSDGVCDDIDPCPLDNPDDSDADGSCDSSDLCIGNDVSGDPDSDGVCNDLDPCDFDALDDADSDGFCADVDNCPTLTNPGQGDIDSDGLGDACDPDADGDQIPGAWEARYGFNDLDDTDAALDPDGDGKDNLTEFQAGTDPLRDGSLPSSYAFPAHNTPLLKAPFDLAVDGQRPLPPLLPVYVPLVEICGDGIDNDGDGILNNGCEGEPCDDGDLCTTDDSFVDQGDIVCAGTPLVCDDGDLCTTDSCDPSTGCLFTPVVCDDSNACTDDLCLAGTGECDFQVNQANSCSDGDASTLNDACNPAGECVGEAGYTAGGAVSGLSGSLVLQNNAGEDLTLVQNGSFAFGPYVSGTAYDVTVLNQPSGQICSVENGVGVISGADVVDVFVTCVTGELPCAQCHLKYQSDLDSFVADDTVESIVSQSEWLTTGHGRTSGSYLSGNPSAGFDLATDNGCLYCHDEALSGTGSHNPAGNFFMLVNNGWDGWGKNGTCMVCHASGSPGYDGAGKMVASNSTIKTASNHYGGDHGEGNPPHNGGQYCWDCHDPHGDMDSNGDALWFMIQKQPFEHTNPEGVPTQLADAVVFHDVGSDGLDCGDYIDVNAGEGRGLCNNCHDASDGVLYYAKNFSDPEHYAATVGRCTDCHGHDDNFAGQASCIDCHSVEVSGESGNHPRRPVMADFAQNGGHPATSDYDCVICHEEGTADTQVSLSHGDGIVDLRGADSGSYEYDDDSPLGTPRVIDLTPNPSVDCGNPSDNYRNSLTHFCQECHDSDGFSDAIFLNDLLAAEAADQDISPKPVRTTSDPFGLGAPVHDVSAQFDPTHFATHSLSCVNNGIGFETGAKRSYENTGSAGMIDPNAFVNGWQEAYASPPTTECADCHLPGGTAGSAAFTNNAHGSATAYLLDDAHGTDQGTLDTEILCFKCHNPETYRSGGSASSASRFDYHRNAAFSNYDAPEDTLFGNQTGIPCFWCHGGGSRGGIHGGSDQVYSSKQGTTTDGYLFFNGAAINYWWTDGVNGAFDFADTETEFLLNPGGVGRDYIRNY